MAGVQFSRKYVSGWVPSNPRAITALMVGVAVVNSAVCGTLQRVALSGTDTYRLPLDIGLRFLHDERSQYSSAI